MQPTYEFGFTSSAYRNEGGSSAYAESYPAIAVLIDGFRIPATVQNSYEDSWEVEIPLTRDNRTRIAKARSIALQLGSEVIATEEIVPNPTSISTIERCLTP